MNSIINIGLATLFVGTSVWLSGFLPQNAIAAEANVIKPVQEGYLEVDGGKLYYQTFGQKGSPIIALHGGPGGSSDYFLPQMLELAKDHQITFYDQRGSGKSLETKVDEKTINVAQFIEDLDKLRQHLGYQNFTLLGHSWGGRLAMEYAITHPLILNSLILVSSAPATYLGQLAFENEFIKPISAKYPEFLNLFDAAKFANLDYNTAYRSYKTFLATYLYDKSDIDKVTIKLNKESLISGIKVAGIMSQETWLRKDFDLSPALNKLKIPTLIIHGIYDPIPMWTAEEIHNAIPKSKIVIIKDCGHLPFVEKPEEFFTVINNFLNK